MRVLCQIDTPDVTEQVPKGQAPISQAIGNAAPAHALPIAWQRGEVADLIAYAGSLSFTSLRVTLGSVLIQSDDRKKNQVYLYNVKKAQVHCSFALENKCRGLAWSAGGAILAVLSAKSAHLTLWHAQTGAATVIDLPVPNDPLTCCAWSLTGQKLVAGTESGYLWLYLADTAQQGRSMDAKHAGRVSSVTWSGEGHLLSIGEDDHSLHITNATTLETISQVILQGAHLSLPDCYLDPYAAASSRNPAMAVAVDEKKLYLHYPNDAEASTELTFSKDYGKIRKISFLANGEIAVAFSVGILVMLSQKGEAIGQEQFATRDFEKGLTTMLLSASRNRLFALGDDHLLRVHDINEEKTIIEDHLLPADLFQQGANGHFETMLLSENEASLAVISKKCHSSFKVQQRCKTDTLASVIQCYSLRILPSPVVAPKQLLHAISEQQIVHYDFSTEEETQALVGHRCAVPCDISLLALNAFTAAVAQANQVWYYDLHALRLNESAPRVISKTYSGVLTRLLLGRMHVAFVMEGQAFVHALSFAEEVEAHPLMAYDGASVVDLYLTDDFAITRDANGQCAYFLLNDGTFSDPNGHPPETGLYRQIVAVPHCRAIFPNQKGTLAILGTSALPTSAGRALPVPTPRSGGAKTAAEQTWSLFDVEADRYTALPLHLLSSPFLSEGDRVVDIQSALWSDGAMSSESRFSRDLCLWCRTEQGQPLSFVLQLNGIHPPRITSRPIVLPVGHQPIQFGPHETLITQSPNGSIHSVPLPTTAEAQVLLPQLLSKAPKEAQAVSPWEALRSGAVASMLHQTRLQAFHGASPADVLFLEKHVTRADELALLAGYASLLENDIGQAEKVLLASSTPALALAVRKALCQYTEALAIADSLCPHQVPELCKLLGATLEAKGDVSAALHMYVRCLTTIGQESSASQPLSITQAWEDLKVEAATGTFRCHIRLGDTTKAMRGLTTLPVKAQPRAMIECAQLLVTLRQFREAASLYEKAGAYNDAFSSALKAKLDTVARPLLPHVTDVQALLEYGQRMIEETQYVEAERAFKQANDQDKLCSLYIHQMKDVMQAAEVVRQSRNKTGAKHIARYFAKSGNHVGHIEFCLIADLIDDAFDYAETHHCMALLSDQPTVFDQTLSTRMAHYFDREKDYLRAGRCWQAAGVFHKALDRWLSCQTPQEGHDTAMEEAIGLIQREAADLRHPLAKKLLTYLLGQVDGVPKDPKYVFQLYMHVGAYQEAAHFALAFAKGEQHKGNYKLAHDLLYENAARLSADGFPIPSGLEMHLAVLHSYTLIKTLSKIGQQHQVARLLSRVAANISDFPKHDIAILTSTIIENYKAGLKKTAYEFAVILLRPENRPRIDEQYKKRIETIVRRPEHEETEEETSPCYYCDALIPHSHLDCASCKQRQPFCIASGMHVVKAMAVRCPHCRFLANRPAFEIWTGMTGTCPMCLQTVTQQI